MQFSQYSFISITCYFFLIEQIVDDLHLYLNFKECSLVYVHWKNFKTTLYKPTLISFGVLLTGFNLISLLPTEQLHLGFTLSYLFHFYTPYFPFTLFISHFLTHFSALQIPPLYEMYRTTLHVPCWFLL